MSSKHIIAIVGLPGAGKSQACEFFKQKNIPVIRFGQITDEGLKAKGLSRTEENEKTFRENLRRELGMAAFAIKNEAKIQEVLKSSNIVVLDGLRSWEEYVYLKEKFTTLDLLALYATPSIRYVRLKERKERSLSNNQARARDIAEVLNLNMGPLIALSDYLIKNETTLEDLNQQLEKFLNSLI